MDSFVVLPASGTSNGFSTHSASAIRPTSVSSDKLSSAVEADDTTSPGTDRSVVTRSEFTPAVAHLQTSSDARRAADNGNMATTNGDRAQLLKDRQRAAWEQMHQRMELRRRDWNAQVDRMRTDFFRLKPSTSAGEDSQSSAVVAADRRQQRVIHVEPSWEPSTITRQQFQASFNVSEYTADEITVETDGLQLIVRARHEQTENDANNTLSREFTRQIDIPRYVDADQLRCTLTDQGILVVEADAVTCSSSSLPVTRAVADRPPPASARFPLTTPPRSPSHSASPTSTSPALCTTAPVILQPDGTCMFRVSVSLGAEFGVDELTVKTVDQRLIVSAQRDETGPGRRAACREFHHEFDLPPSVDPQTVTAHVTDDGQLVVEAPLSAPCTTTTTTTPTHSTPP